MKMDKREKNAAGSLNLEPSQHKTIKKEYESVATGILKGLLYLALTAVVYYFVFSNGPKVLELLTSQTYIAPLIAMSLVVLVAFLMGSGINKLIKSTLEKALESQNLREE